MHAAEGIGLAAIQIGVPRRCIVADVHLADEPPAPLKLVNPEIVWRSDDRVSREEGCLSFPDHYAEVERPASVTVAYLDETGAAQEITAVGTLAVCLQHEIDHLEGSALRGLPVAGQAQHHPAQADQGAPRRRRLRHQFSSRASTAQEPMRPLRLVFMGTPAFAVPTFDALCASGHSIAAVYTQPPRAAERGRKVRPTPVAVRAEGRRDSRVMTPASLKPEETQTRVRGVGRGPRGHRRLWFDPAAGGAVRRPGSAASTPMPRYCRAGRGRCADPAGDHGGRYGDRRHHHADGRGPRHGPLAHGRARCRSGQRPRAARCTTRSPRSQPG